MFREQKCPLKANRISIMNLLILDTSSRILTVAALYNGTIYSRSFDAGMSGHTASLLLTIDEIFKESCANSNDFSVVAAVVGPGSFTGIRIGASTATALAFSSGAKRVQIRSFEVIAYNRGEILAAVEAGRGNKYVASCKDGEITDTFFYTEEEYKVAEKKKKKFIFTPLGDVAETLVAIAQRKVEKGEFSPAFEPYYMRKPQAERNAQ